jgi:hypothetical protein
MGCRRQLEHGPICDVCGQADGRQCSGRGRGRGLQRRGQLGGRGQRQGRDLQRDGRNLDHDGQPERSAGLLRGRASGGRTRPGHRRRHRRGHLLFELQALRLGYRNMDRDRAAPLRQDLGGLCPAERRPSPGRRPCRCPTNERTGKPCGWPTGQSSSSGATTARRTAARPEAATAGGHCPTRCATFRPFPDARSIASRSCFRRATSGPTT